MAKPRHRILFSPSEYRELSPSEQSLLEIGYQEAKKVLYKNITPLGFSACSLADNQVYGTDVNYRSVWARDGAMTVVWTLDVDEPEIRECQTNTLRTLLEHRAPNGLIPANVRIDTKQPDYSGVGGIAAIDAALWLIIALWRYSDETEDWSIVEDHADGLQKVMDWLAAHDSNNCGLLEIPEAGDWTDLFARSYHVLYDEVLWYRCLCCYANLVDHRGESDKAEEYRKLGRQVRQMILSNFWPTTSTPATDNPLTRFTAAQTELGDARYLLAQLSPFGFSWRCDVLGNLLAFILYDLISKDQAMKTFRFLWGVGINEPAPVRNLYPPVHSADPEWRDYFTVNLLNLPNHYHNGGVWPFIGGLWVRYIRKLGMVDIARREMVKLAQCCARGVEHEWEFNEWYHGETGRPMGKAYQAWSAASFIQAAHDLNLDATQIDHHE
jgi:glycogen debranching enzyme